MLMTLAISAAFIAGLLLHILIRPHLGALASLVVAVAGGLAVEALILLLLRRGRARALARK